MEIYIYDRLDRLTYASGPWGDVGYGYDRVGNRVTLQRDMSTISYGYDDMDRLVSATGMGFSWDGNGNMVYMDDGVSEWDYGYDPLNRLVSDERDDVLTASYSYDVGGRRVRGWDAVDGTTDYVYRGLNVIDEINGGVHEKYIYAGMTHVASVVGGVTEFYHVDHLGSTRLKTDEGGSVVYGSSYEPFGVGYGESGDEDYRYTGKQEDSTGLYYYGARYYDPIVGRFTTRDTVMGDLTDPQTLNRYVYCRNNPNKYTDPDGKWMHIVAGAVIGAGINMGMYTFTSIITGTDLHSESFRRGLIATGVSGAISGGLSAALGPAAGTVAKAITGSAGSSSVKTVVTLGGQVISEGLAYAAESVISGEEMTLGDAGRNIAAGVLMSQGSERLIRQTRGMSTLMQADYFTPKKISTYAKAFFNHPDASRNAMAIMNAVSFEALGTGLVSTVYTVVTSSGSSVSPSVYDDYEGRRF